MANSKHIKTPKHEERGPKPPELSAEDLEGVVGGSVSGLPTPEGRELDVMNESMQAGRVLRLDDDTLDDAHRALQALRATESG